jgi:diacylglycerol kinase family enzyme
MKPKEFVAALRDVADQFEQDFDGVLASWGIFADAQAISVQMSANGFDYASAHFEKIRVVAEFECSSMRLEITKESPKEKMK